jgi:hypothetical protein
MVGVASQFGTAFPINYGDSSEWTLTNCFWASVPPLRIVLRIEQAIRIVAILVLLTVAVIASPWVVHVHVTQNILQRKRHHEQNNQNVRHFDR